MLPSANTGVKMYNSDEIIKYLWSEYGVHAEAPWNYSLAKIGIVEMFALPLTTFCRKPLQIFALRKRLSIIDQLGWWRAGCGVCTADNGLGVVYD